MYHRNAQHELNSYRYCLVSKPLCLLPVLLVYWSEVKDSSIRKRLREKGEGIYF